MSNLTQLRATLTKALVSAAILSKQPDACLEEDNLVGYIEDALDCLEAVEREQAPTLIMQMMPDGTEQPLLPPEYYEWLGFRKASQRSEGEV
jgi:hypothetical protein